MNERPSLFGPSSNPLVQVASLLLFGLVVIGAVVMGAVILALVLGLALIGAIAFSLRVWWLRRKFARAAAEQGYRDPGTSGRLIEAEYTVVEQRDPQASGSGDATARAPEGSRDPRGSDSTSGSAGRGR